MVKTTFIWPDKLEIQVIEAPEAPLTIAVGVTSVFVALSRIVKFSLNAEKTFPIEKVYENPFTTFNVTNCPAFTNAVFIVLLLSTQNVLTEVATGKQGPPVVSGLIIIANELLFNIQPEGLLTSLTTRR